jgi:hypothetical protein
MLPHFLHSSKALLSTHTFPNISEVNKNQSLPLSTHTLNPIHFQIPNLNHTMALFSPEQKVHTA